MTTPADPVPPPLTPSQRVVSGFWRRLAALLVDYLVLATVEPARPQGNPA